MPQYATSIDSARAFRASYEARLGVGAPTLLERAAAVADFRELVLSKIGRLTPTRAREVIRAVEDDWGSGCERRVERAIAWLFAHGKIVREPAGYLRTKAARHA